MSNEGRKIRMSVQERQGPISHSTYDRDLSQCFAYEFTERPSSGVEKQRDLLMRPDCFGIVDASPVTGFRYDGDKPPAVRTDSLPVKLALFSS